MAGDQLVSELNEDELAHYGVLGMKWGVRKEDLPQPEEAYRQKLKGGGELVVMTRPPGAIRRTLARMSKRYKKTVDEYHSFTLNNSAGEKVGDASFFETSPTSLHLAWLGVDQEHRRQGYASAVMTGMVDYARDQGYKKLELEMTDDSGTAQRIYEKHGFKVLDPNDPFHTMVLNLDQDRVKHEMGPQTFAEYIARAFETTFEEDGMSGDKLVSELADDELAHYGVLGMKWGRRKDRGSRVTPSEDSKNVRELRTKKVSELSNKELRDLTQRQQLERQYAQLNPRMTEKGKNYVKAGIAFGATGVAVYNMVNSPAGKAAIKAGRTAYEKLVNKL